VPNRHLVAEASTASPYCKSAQPCKVLPTHTDSHFPYVARVSVQSGSTNGESRRCALFLQESMQSTYRLDTPPSVAARLQALASPGSIVITEPVRKLVEGYFALKSLGPARIRGVSEPLEIYEVTGLGPLRTRLQRGAARGYTKFVGRQREMETLKRAAELTQAGHGQIVAAVAEHGVGKSRLFVEFKAKIQSGWMVLEAFSVSHGKASAYLPVLDLLHSYFKITSDDDARSRREKVAGKITVLDRSLEDALPYLFALLGIVESEDPLAQMDGQVKKRRTLDAIKRILLRESLNQPLIVMFEDPHWTASEQFTLRSFELSRRRGVSWEKSWLAISALCTTAVFRAMFRERVNWRYRRSRLRSSTKTQN